jgi:membrane-bound lytic murein transglycosylase D
MLSILRGAGTGLSHLSTLPDASAIPTIAQMHFRILRNLILASVVACGLVACSEDDSSQQTAWYESHTIYAYNANKGNLWVHMRSHLALSSYADTPQVRKQIIYFEHHQNYLNRVIAESAPYIYYIYQQTKVHHLPADLALIPVIESEYNPYARSHAGAEGLWQMMPSTARGFGLKRDWWYNGSKDVMASTNAALDYFSYLHSFFNNNWLLAIGAYDCGEGTVMVAVHANEYHHRPTDFWDLPLPYETRNYVPRLLAVSAIVKDPERYGIHLAPINDTPYIAQVNVGSQMQLSKAAQLADVPLNTLKVLNPALKHDETDPHGPYTIVMPTDSVPTFNEKLAALAHDEGVAIEKHVVQSEATLTKIADKYHTSKTHLAANDSSNKTTQSTEQAVASPATNPDTNTVIAASTDTTNTAPVIITYKVKHGDDLNKIAARFNTTIEKLRTTNHLASNTLQIGQLLEVPNKNIEPVLATASAKVTSHPKTYVVRKGDYINKIATNLDVSPTDLLKWNKLSEESELQPGQKLIIHD